MKKKILSKGKTHDYTKEICRCASFISNQIEKGLSPKTAITQAKSSYGFRVCEETIKGFNRYFNKTKTKPSELFY